MSKVDTWKNNWNLNRKTDMRMMNVEMVKGYGAGEEQKKDDPVIDEDLQSDTKMDQQEPHNLVMGSRVNANYMTSDWSDVFALSCTEARLHGFYVNQYSSKESSKKLNFYGLFIGDAARVKETQTQINKCNLQDKEVSEDMNRAVREDQTGQLGNRGRP